MWDSLKKIFSPGGPLPKIQPLSFRDGVLAFQAGEKLKFGKQKVMASSKIGEIEVALNVLSYDQNENLYRAELDNEVFTLDAMGLERRGEFRLKQEVRVTSPELPGRVGTTEDISLTGLRLSLKEPVKPGEYLGVTLHFNDPTLPDLEVSGETRWCAPKKKGYHCGFRFISLEKAQKVAISRYIKNRVTMGAKLPT